jgi:iron-sulfur cluster repair protein YtfE (RIC family)
MYGVPHRGLRYILCHLLIEMGRTSFGDDREAGMVLEAMEVALVQCDRHIHHEDDVIRPALVARAPRAVSTLDEEHAQHATQVAELRAMAKALREATSTEHRASIGRTLYLHFSVFVAETLAHMAYEERVVQPLLDRSFTFEEQLGLHLTIVKSIAPTDMMEFLRAAIPASTREQRFEILSGGRAMMPPPAFLAVVNELLPLLSTNDANDLKQRLEL